MRALGNFRQFWIFAIAGRPRATSHWIAAQDYAGQVVAALRRAERGVGREYAVQGPEPFTADEAARIFVANHAAEQLSVAHAPLFVFKLLGLFSPTMDYVRQISRALNTTRNTMTGSVLALDRNPDQYSKLRADPGLLPAMVSETIRWQAPLAHVKRRATRDVELGGKLIKEGETVVMWYVSGIR